MLGEDGGLLTELATGDWMAEITLLFTLTGKRNTLDIDRYCHIMTVIDI